MIPIDDACGIEMAEESALLLVDPRLRAASMRGEVAEHRHSMRSRSDGGGPLRFGVHVSVTLVVILSLGIYYATTIVAIDERILQPQPEPTVSSRHSYGDGPLTILATLQPVLAHHGMRGSTLPSPAQLTEPPATTVCRQDSYTTCEVQFSSALCKADTYMNFAWCLKKAGCVDDPAARGVILSTLQNARARCCPSCDLLPPLPLSDPPTRSPTRRLTPAPSQFPTTVAPTFEPDSWECHESAYVECEEAYSKNGCNELSYLEFKHCLSVANCVTDAHTAASIRQQLEAARGQCCPFCPNELLSQGVQRFAHDLLKDVGELKMPPANSAVSSASPAKEHRAATNLNATQLTQLCDGAMRRCHASVEMISEELVAMRLATNAAKRRVHFAKLCGLIAKGYTCFGRCVEHVGMPREIAQHEQECRRVLAPPHKL